MLYRYIRANFYFEAAQTLALRQQVCGCEREERRQTQSPRVCFDRTPGHLRGVGGGGGGGGSVPEVSWAG
eukprot:COSAG01_NODE_1694_length_9467_cov_4.976196_4_plen_70_part_00